MDNLLAKEIEQSIAARRIKVPLPGTMSKQRLKAFIREARWDVIGAYFDFAPRFITTVTGKATFDWCSCPPAMTELLQQKVIDNYLMQTRDKASRRSNPGRKERLHVEQEGKCFYCGDVFILALFSADHVTPVSRGGLKGKKNTVGACKTCNNKKGNMTLAEFLSTDYLKEERRRALGATQPPSMSYNQAKNSHEERLGWNGVKKSSHSPA